MFIKNNIIITKLHAEFNRPMLYMFHTFIIQIWFFEVIM